ncbi:MAG: dUTP diphosphatase [Syntrophomonadaceae bacterium]|jgi:dUTP pyrophosphatase
MEIIEISFEKLVEWARIPEYETKGAAGCDISIALQEETVLYPHEVNSYPTGFAIRIPDGYEAQIRSRAGMVKKGIAVANAPGTIDSAHRGEVVLLLVNISDKPVKLFPGQKVAQMVFHPVVRADFVE